MIDQSLVWDQPTLLAWHSHHQAVTAVGEKAASLRGKTPAYIQLVAPIQQGVIAELDWAKLYLKAVLNHLRFEKKLNSWLPVSCHLVIPANSSPLEVDQFKFTLEQAGMKVKKIIIKPQAIIALNELKQLNQAHGVIDLGAQTTDVGIFVGQELIRAVTLTVANGDDFTQAVMEQVLTEYDLKIGWAAAQQIKHQLGALLNSSGIIKTSVVTVRGKHTKTHLVTAVRVKSSSFQARFQQLANLLIDELKEVISELPAEVVIQLQEQGFYLTGGNSQLPDWQVVLKEALLTPVIISKSPQIDAVKGLSCVR